ncbi:MAG: hypothetical protein RIT26_1332 [Pseudomonadota bacterium]|jgi:hypothetical protein
MSDAMHWFEQGLSLAQASRVFMFLLGWSLLLQTLEYLAIARLDRVLTWDLQRHEMPAWPAFLRPALTRCFAPRVYLGVLTGRLLCAVMLMAGLHGLWLSLPLMVLAVLLLFRWRGAFNGGSDFMTLVGLTGLLWADGLSPWVGTELAWRAGLWWVSLQLLTSYFMSGWVKLKHRGWRNGTALPMFLDTGVYGPLPANSLLRHPGLTRIVAWAFILWEGLFGLVFLDIRLAWIGCALGALFHFLVFWYFGLNRFFWAWLATYPALIYSVTEWGLSLR